jgi:hypothetical protein
MPDYFGKAVLSFQANLDRKKPPTSSEQIKNLSDGLSNLAYEIEHRLWQIQATLNHLTRELEKLKHVRGLNTTPQKKSRSKR